MKIKLLSLIVALFIFSCSKDNDPSPSLENTSLSLAQGTQIVTPPAGIMTSTNPYAEMVAEYFDQANAMTSFTALFTIPQGATKSSTKITASNSRVDNAGDYVVYEWTDSQSGQKVAYQITEYADKYTWELFYKSAGQSSYLRFISAEEKKDQSAGFFKIYNIDGSNSSLVWLSYTWTRTGDTLKILIADNLFGEKIDMTFNTKTKAGSVVFTYNNIKAYEMTWDEKGNGTWKEYDSKGALTSQGSWTV